MTLVLIDFAELKYASLSAERIIDLQKEQTLGGTKTKENVTGKLELNVVTFAYNEEDEL